MKTKTAPLCLVLLTALCPGTFTHASSTLIITRAWVREAPPASHVLAAYMTIKNPGDAAVSINSVYSPDFESAEIHRTVINEGMARMLHQKQLEVPANETIRLEPGALHLMLINPVRPLVAGDNITLVLHLSNDICLTLSTPVLREAGVEQTQQYH